jgi:hypothetical protein
LDAGNSHSSTHFALRVPRHLTITREAEPNRGSKDGNIRYHCRSSSLRLCADERTPATHAAVTSHIIQSDEVCASKMIASTVYDLQTAIIGEVSDVLKGGA